MGNLRFLSLIFVLAVQSAAQGTLADYQRSVELTSKWRPYTAGAAGPIRWIGDSDPTSRRVVESILEEEEEHADDLNDLLGN